MNPAQEITAAEIEAVFGQNGASARFANFCNAVIVAEGTSAISRFPVLSEKPGADGAFDGEWDIELREGEHFENSFAKAGWNLFQFKSRGIQGGGRRKAISVLKNSLKEAISDLVGRLNGKKQPTQYVLFTNLQLGLESESTTKSEKLLSQDRKALKAAIIKNYTSTISVQIVDAGLLAALVNKHPALRLTYFATPVARSWDEKWAEERDVKDYKTSVSLIGREHESETIGKWIADGTTKVIALSGPPGIGKTRLALESTRGNRWRTIVIDVVEEFQRWTLTAFNTSNQPRIIIVEDPDARQAENLAKQAISISGIKLIFTFPSQTDTPKLKLTGHDGIKELFLLPLSNEQSKKLLLDAGAHFDLNALDWIILQAGGNPDILLSAAELGGELRKNTGSLKSNLARLYQKRIERKLGNEAFYVLRLVSPLQWAKVTGEQNDIPALVASFESQLASTIILDFLKRLEVMGYVRRRGNFVMVVPPLFAAALAEELHKEQANVVCTLFDRLDDSSRKRLLERVVTTDLEENSTFWNYIFGGEIGTISRLTVNLEVLGYLARAVPLRTASFLARRIDELIGHTYELRETLRDLVYQEESCAIGMGIVQKLAMEEPWEQKNISDHSATHLFCECFVHWYFEFPMSFQDRERWIRQMLESGESNQMRLAARAVVMVTEPPHSLSSYTPNARKLGPAPQQRLWREVFDYLNNFLQLRFDLTQSDDDQIAELVQNGFAISFQELAHNLNPDFLIGHLEKFMDWVDAGKIKTDVRDLRSVIHWLQEDYSKSGKDPKQAEFAEKWREINRRIESLRRRLDEGPFILRLQVALGREISAEWEEIDGKRVYEFEKRCNLIAGEAVAAPKLMTTEAWNVVNDPRSFQSHTFILSLGRLDTNREFLPHFESQTGEGRGNHNFGLYLAGLQNHASDFIDQHLNELNQQPNFAKGAILDAIKFVGSTPGNRSRLLGLIRDKSVEPFAVAGMFTFGRWLENVPIEEVRGILEFIAAGPKEWPKWIIRVVSLYLHPGKALPAELIPIVLRAIQNPISNDTEMDWHRAQVAIGIAKTDLDQTFALFARDIRLIASADRWERESMLSMFHRHGSQEFWRFLCVNSPERTCREMLALEEEISKIGKIHLAFDLEENLALILKIALESERNASFFAKAVLGLQNGFFRFAYAIMDAFPASESVRSSLTKAAIYQTGYGVDGEYTQALNAIESEIASSKTPTEHIGWLNAIKEKIKHTPPRFSFYGKDKDEFLDWNSAR